MTLIQNACARMRTNHRGFTLVETMIAIVLLAFGVLSLAAVLCQGMLYRSSSQSDLIAKEKAAAAIECMFTARDTRVLTWAQLRNTSAGGGAVFLDGSQPLLDPGPDGMVNTVDDDITRPDVIIDPGPDGILGNSDDQIVPLTRFRREILITDVNPNLRLVQAIVTYQVGRLQRQYALNTYMSSFN